MPVQCSHRPACGAHRTDIIPVAVTLNRSRSAVALTLVLAACTASPKATPTPSPSASPSASASPTPPPAADWTAYHHDAARTGAATGPSVFHSVKRSWSSPKLDGLVYAEPLVVGSHVIVATEANSVYALNVTSGTVAWRRTIGLPVDGASLPCGNIDPSGITGTPVADARAGMLYVVAFLSGGPRHELYALDLATGRVRWHRVIDPPGLSPSVEQQRGALALANGRVYVPFGGLQGDCGPYKGAVVSSATSGTGTLASYIVPTRREAGIWQPAGPVADAHGDLWITTGNSASQGSFDYGNAVIRLSASLAVRDWFAPTDWQRLNAGDIDLGSVGVVLLPNDRALAAGKAGIAYLLNRTKLGHLGGEIASAHVCSRAFGTAVADDTMAYIPCEDGLVGVTVGASSLALAWRHPGGAGPVILFGGAVWSLGYGGLLVALDPRTGAERFRLRLAQPPSRFTSLSAFGSRLFVPERNRITCFEVA